MRVLKKIYTEFFAFNEIKFFCTNDFLVIYTVQSRKTTLACQLLYIECCKGVRASLKITHS